MTGSRREGILLLIVNGVCGTASIAAAVCVNRAPVGLRVFLAAMGGASLCAAAALAVLLLAAPTRGGSNG